MDGPEVGRRGRGKPAHLLDGPGCPVLNGPSGAQLRSAEWINQRLQAIQVRKELTDQWKSHGVRQGKEYAILADEITRAWSGMSTREYKNLKGLKKENLRDNMSTLELVLNMLAEATTTELTKMQHPQGLQENKEIAKEG